VLQDRNVPEAGYAEYMDLTASAYGHELRDALRAGKVDQDLLTNWHHTMTPDRLVTWVESHDTYCNAHESADMTDEQMRMGWSISDCPPARTPAVLQPPRRQHPRELLGQQPHRRPRQR